MLYFNVLFLSQRGRWVKNKIGGSPIQISHFAFFPTYFDGTWPFANQNSIVVSFLDSHANLSIFLGYHAGW